MVVRVEYDRSNRVCIRRTGNRPSYAVAQETVHDIEVALDAGAVMEHKGYGWCVL